MSALERLRAILRTEVPITRHLGVEVASYRSGCLTLRAPLAANLNHKGTAFAGSLNAIATLAGWGLVWLALDEAGLRGHVVIQDSTVRYLRPVTGDFHATCGPPHDGSLSRLLESLRRRGLGRITLDTVVADAAGHAVTFSGRYVVQALREPSENE
jgi:thioesterase domain-containing protein